MLVANKYLSMPIPGIKMWKVPFICFVGRTIAMFGTRASFGSLSVWSDHHSCQCFLPVFTFSSNPHLYCYFFLIQQRIYPSVNFLTFSWVLTMTFSAWCTYSSRDSYLISFLEAGVVGPNCGVIAFCTKGDQHRTAA